MSLGLDVELIEQMIDLIPYEKEGKRSEEIVEEQILQGGDLEASKDMEYVHLGVFEHIVEKIYTRTKVEIKTMAQLLDLSDEIIERYESDDAMGFYRSEFAQSTQGMFDLEGKENKGYYQCYKRFTHSMIAQACMLVHISHLYGYKIRGEDLPRVLLALRKMIAKECAERKITYLLQGKMYLIVGRVLRKILENHYPELARFDILSCMHNAEIFNDLGAEIRRAMKLEISYIRRLDCEGISSRRIFRGA